MNFTKFTRKLAVLLSIAMVFAQTAQAAPVFNFEEDQPEDPASVNIQGKFVKCLDNDSANDPLTPGNVFIKGALDMFGRLISQDDTVMNGAVQEYMCNPEVFGADGTDVIPSRIWENKVLVTNPLLFLNLIIPAGVPIPCEFGHNRNNCLEEVIEPAGELTVSDGLLIDTETALRGQLDIELAGFNFEASDEDIVLERLQFTIIGDSNSLSNVRLRNAGGEPVGRIHAIVQNDGTVTFQGDLLELTEGEPQHLTISADIGRNGADGESVSVTIQDSSSVQARGLESAEEVDINGNFPVRGADVQLFNSGSFQVNQIFPRDLDPRGVMPGDIQLLQFQVLAYDLEDIGLEDVTFHVEGAQNIFRLDLLDEDENIIGSSYQTFREQIRIHLNERYVVEQGTREHFTLKAVVYEGHNGNIDFGGSMQARIDEPSDIEAIGMTSAMLIEPGGRFPMNGPIMNIVRGYLTSNLSVNYLDVYQGERETLVSWTFNANHEDLIIRSMEVNVTNSDNIERGYLLNDGEIIAEAVPNQDKFRFEFEHGVEVIQAEQWDFETITFEVDIKEDANVDETLTVSIQEEQDVVVEYLDSGERTYFYGRTFPLSWGPISIRARRIIFL